MINQDLFIYSPVASLKFKEVLEYCINYLNPNGIKYIIVFNDYYNIKCLKSSIPEDFGF